MDWGNLFFKFDGRINRGKFWIAALVYAVLDLTLVIIGYLLDENGAFQAINGMLGIVILISAIAVGIKRLHDRNKSGWYLLPFYLLPGILLGAGLMFPERSNIVATVLALLAFAISIWAFVELGCLRGTIGVNPYGPDPVAPVIVPPVRNPLG
jgi:uncharacterized membrane protein YhaH (DUF805 family)